MANRGKGAGNRWVPVAAGAASLAAAGVAAARWRASRRPLDPREEFAVGLRQSHEALRRNLARFMGIVDRDARLDTGALGTYLGLYGQFLIVHHQCEDLVVFPMLRRHGQLRSTDAAHLDGWSAEHRAVNAAGEALVHAGDQLEHTGRAALPEVRARSAELRALLLPHLAAEEELFTPSRLAEIIPPQAIGEIERQSRTLFRGLQEMPLLLAPALDRQEPLSGRRPWIFRKVLFPLMDRRCAFAARLTPFTISPSLQV
jgi:hypothetical protein